MITLKQVKKSYGSGETRTPVLRGIDLQIADGEFAVILGASGSGKSTLLHVMSGLERCDGGEVLYDQTCLNHCTDAQLTALRREYCGFVFQQYYLLASLTVEQNVRMGANLAGNRAYREILAAVGLENRLRMYPSQLSGGEQQRVSIARALAKRPKVLFLDEPTGALDEQTGRQVLAYLCDLHQTYGFSMVMVTHNPNIAQLADTVIRMNSGRLIERVRNASRKRVDEIDW